MKNYITTNQKTNNGDIMYTFVPESNLKNVPGPINASLVIPMIGDAYVLVNKPSGIWDIIGGKLEESETPIDAIKREAYEEAGLELNDVTMLIGYIKCGNQYQPLKHFDMLNYMPIFIAFVKSVERGWKPPHNEILERRLVSYKKAIKLLVTRTDQGQLEQILSYARDVVNSKKPTYEFDFIAMSEADESKGPVTQVMSFCIDSNGQYCIVKDKDEDFYSLPGGGCELDETPTAAIAREVDEEAQLIPKQFRVMGSVLVTMKIDGEPVSLSQHIRYISGIGEDMKEFVPEMGGFETVERIFIDKIDLQNKVMLLNNKTGQDIISRL